MIKRSGRPSSFSASTGRFDLFPLLPDTLRQAFASVANTRRYSAGQTIYFQGDVGSELYRIATGFVRLSYMHHDGRELVYIRFEPNDCFGYSSLIDGKGLPHTAEAQSNVEVQVIGRDAFNALREHRVFDDALLRLICSHMRLLSNYVADATLDELASRLALRLLELARPNEAGLPTVQLSQEELGLMIGASRQSVNKLLKQFQTEKLVHLAYGNVLVDNLGALRRRAKAGY